MIGVAVGVRLVWRACRCVSLIGVLLAGFVGVLGFGVSPAAAAVLPWWHLSASAVPSYLPAEGTGEVVLGMTNLGDADINGENTPVRILVSLPAGFKATSLAAAAGAAGNTKDEANRGKVICPSFEVVPLVCTFEGTLPPFDQLEVTVGVEVLAGAVSGEEVKASVSGGGAPPASLGRPLTVSDEGEGAVPFGLQDNELSLEGPAGAPATQAGSHPFQVTGTLVFNQIFQLGVKETVLPAPSGLLKDVNVKLPAGLVGNPTPLPRCSLGQFLTRSGEEEDACPAQAAVGVASVLINEPFLGVKGFTVPVFNLEPEYGEPARFGFYIGVTETPVLLDTAVRSGPGEDYGVTISSLNTTQTASLLSTQVTFWGVPGSPAHDNARGWGCLAAARFGGSCGTIEDQHPPAFLVLPTSCTGQPLESQATIDSWAAPTSLLTVPSSSALATLDGCNELSFTPAIQAEPTTNSASSPSGLDFNLDFHDEGLTNAEGTAQSELKNTAVTLPEGFTINPSSGVGLAGCTPADYARETVDSAPGAGCPNESKLGTVEIETPLLTQKIQGSIFIAQPYENPFPEPPSHPNGTLVALYIVAKNPETGILVKLAGKVIPNLVTGQLTTIFENNPQLPFDHFNFHFREGQQAPLITPATCGTYQTQAQLTPWSEPTSALTDTSSFTISTGVGGGACPAGGVPPFAPQIQAGTVNNNAGAFSEFYLQLTRTDADQEISSFSTSLPLGLVGILAGIPFCPEADIALARAKTGQQELASPSCPAASELGHSLVGTGAGATLAYTPGKIYLAGPYNGDPFSLVSVTSAVVGPFDLGTVVIRFGLRIDPRTAQVSVDPTASEPIPTIIDGIVTHVRDIRVYISRPNFMLNPTSCQPTAISSTLTGNQGATATISSPFQAASCANLKFTPAITVKTAGQASKVNGTSLTFKIAYPKNPVGTQAWFNEAKFDIPKQLPARLTTLQKACLAHTFETNRTACPAASKIGHAIVHTPVLPVPLEGPVYFVSYGSAKFPEAVLALQGYGITIELHGETFISKTDVTSATFHNLPDVPFENIEVTIPTGPYSEFGVNIPPQDNYNVCSQKLTMPTLFKAANGQQINQTTPITITGCKPKPTKLQAALQACHKNKNHNKRLKCEQTAHKHN